MAKVTITFESDTQLPSGAEVFTYEVDEQYAPDFKAAVAAHPVYGKVIETVMIENGALDGNGNPVLVPELRPRDATFPEGLEAWANLNVRDVILGAVNKFRKAKIDAKKAAEAAAEFEPITTK